MLRPLVQEAFEVSLDGWLAYEEIWDYVEAKMPNCDRLVLIDLLNSDKKHFVKDVKR